MADVVFVLGAGASKTAGVPLMLEFLDRASELRRQGLVEDAAIAFDEVEQAVSHLQQVHSKARLDIHNVESVFAAFEMAMILGTFGGYSADRIATLVPSMTRLIVKTVEQTSQFTVGGDPPRIQPPKPYDKLVTLLKDLRGAKPCRSVAVLTLNFDIAADYAFNFMSVPVDYGLGPALGAGAVPLLKLHGSINWARCKGCGGIVPWAVGDFLRGPIVMDMLMSGMKTVILEPGSAITRVDHCNGAGVEDQPVIVPPTWNKAHHHLMLTSVWGAAARELATAEDIYFIGYSLPDSDYFFRYFFALGSLGKQTLRRVWVINPDNDVSERFRSLLGPGAEQRFRFLAMTFADGIDRIRTEYLPDPPRSVVRAW